VGTRCADHVTSLYPQKLALTSPTGGGRSVGIVRVRTKATESLSLLSFFGVDVCLPAYCRCRGYCCTWSHSDTRTRKDTSERGMALRRNLYRTTHNTPKRQTSISSARFEPTMTTSERPQTHALDHAVTRIGFILSFIPIYNKRCS